METSTHPGCRKVVQSNAQMVKNEEFCMLTFDSFMAGFGRFGPKQCFLIINPLYSKNTLNLAG